MTAAARARALRDRVFWRCWGTRTAVVVATVLLVAGLVVASRQTNAERAAILFVGGAAWVVLGAYHRTRSTDPVGAWAVIAGGAYLIARLDEARDPWLFTIGNVISMVDVPLFVLVLATFPVGRLSVCPAATVPGSGLADPRRVRGLRRLILVTCAWAVVMELWVLFDRNPNPGQRGSEGRNHVIAEIPALAVPWAALQAVTFVVIAGFALAACERVFRGRDAMHRAAHLPVRLGIWLLMCAFFTFMLTTAIGSAGLVNAASVVTKVSFMALPVLYGFGLFRWRELEDAAMARLELSTAAGRTMVEAALRDALRDPGLHLGPVGPPGAPSATRTVLRHPDGTPIATVGHAPRISDSMLLDRALEWAGGRLAVEEEADTWRPWASRVAGLTDAELVTALRLVERRTNREIAEDLVLAVGSVNNRVSRIYRKLDLNELSRRERAATVARLRPVIGAEARSRGIPPDA